MTEARGASSGRNEDPRVAAQDGDGWYRAFAPATVANFGSGFDAFAAALRSFPGGAATGTFAGAGPGTSGERAPAGSFRPANQTKSRAGPAGVGDLRGGNERGDDRIRLGVSPASARASAPGLETAVAEILLGDRVSVRRSEQRGVRIVAITGDGGRLPRSASRNCAAVAAGAVLQRAGASFGLDLVLDKGLPLSSGLGSSAASAAAGAFAAALALETTVDKNDLIAPALAGEHVADGAWHGDNVWASLMGGGVIVVSTRPPEIVRVPSPSGLEWVTVHPHFELTTRRARAALPKTVPLADATAQVGRFAAFVDAWSRGDREGIGRSLQDRLAEPYRAPLVPGYAAVRRAALRAGAYGLCFAGAGPSVIAVAPEGGEEVVGDAIVRAFARAGLGSERVTCAVDSEGARRS